jgi:hypothetical protein
LTCALWRYEGKEKDRRMKDEAVIEVEVKALLLGVQKA